MTEIEHFQGEEVRLFATVEAWEQWLDQRPGDSPGMWVKLAKKGSGVESITYADALESALCFGWIDSHKRPYDEVHWLQRFGPRKPRSKWSKINCERVAKLTADGRMREQGQREVERAKDDGRWEAAYESQSSATVPEDLRAALDADPEAASFFETLDSANRYAVLYRVQEAKRADTRARRIEKFVAMLHAHETVHPQRAKRQ